MDREESTPWRLFFFVAAVTSVVGVRSWEPNPPRHIRFSGQQNRPGYYRRSDYFVIGGGLHACDRRRASKVPPVSRKGAPPCDVEFLRPSVEGRSLSCLPRSRALHRNNDIIARQYHRRVLYTGSAHTDSACQKGKKTCPTNNRCKHVWEGVAICIVSFLRAHRAAYGSTISASPSRKRFFFPCGACLLCMWSFRSSLWSGSLAGEDRVGGFLVFLFCIGV